MVVLCTKSVQPQRPPIHNDGMYRIVQHTGLYQLAYTSGLSINLDEGLTRLLTHELAIGQAVFDALQQVGAASLGEA